VNQLAWRGSHTTSEPPAQQVEKAFHNRLVVAEGGWHLHEQRAKRLSKRGNLVQEAGERLHCVH
jgi:hypothetical protein